jgi:hypothetical protein
MAQRRFEDAVALYKRHGERGVGVRLNIKGMVERWLAATNEQLMFSFKPALSKLAFDVDVEPTDLQVLINFMGARVWDETHGHLVLTSAQRGRLASFLKRRVKRTLEDITGLSVYVDYLTQPSEE